MKTRLFNSQRFSALIHSATSTFILSIELTLGTATQALAQETASPKSTLTKEAVLNMSIDQLGDLSFEDLLLAVDLLRLTTWTSSTPS